MELKVANTDIFWVQAPNLKKKRNFSGRGILVGSVGASYSF